MPVSVPRRSSPTTYPPASWIRGTAAQFACLIAFMPWAHAHTLRFVLHLLVCAGFEKDSAEAGFVPVPSKFIWTYFRHASREKARLLDEDIIEMIPYSRVRRRCAEYRVCLQLQVAFAEAGLTQDYSFTEEAVNLVTGRPTARRTRSLLKDEHNHRFPPLVHAAISSVGPSIFNMGAIRQHLLWKKERIAEASPGREQAKALRQYEVDVRCFGAVSDQGHCALDADDLDGLHSYTPAYKPQRFGRISQIGGGLQSCSGEMKEAAYSGVPGFRNYDLRASQPTLLIVLLGEAGMDASWLREYAAFGKVAAAARVGVSVNTWKKLLCALLMGAWTPSEAQAAFRPQSRRVDVQRHGAANNSGRGTWTLPFSRGTITDSILAEVGNGDFLPTYQRFIVYTTALRASLHDWHLWLDTTFVAESGRHNPANGKTYLTNAVGARVAVEDLSGSAFQRRSQLAAFQLQGREAALIHTLVSLSGSYGFTVLSHEHDGLAVQGVIPEAAVREASARSKIPLEDVVLEEKLFT